MNQHGSMLIADGTPLRFTHIPFLNIPSV